MPVLIIKRQISSAIPPIRKTKLKEFQKSYQPQPVAQPVAVEY